MDAPEIIGQYSDSGEIKMSQWTHVCGCIRYDALRMAGMPYSTLDQIKELIGISARYDDPSEKQNAVNGAMGSEGSIEFVFYVNPSTPSLSACAVGIVGDLRDFGNEDVHKIKEWFKKVTTGKGVMIRSAILEIDVEGESEPIILRYKD